MDMLDAALQRWVVIAFAILGGAIATLGGLLSRKSSDFDPRWAKMITRFGYAVSWVSVGIFVAIGFRGPS